VVKHYFFANGQPYTGAAVLRAAMQALKNLKYFILVLLLETNAIIGNAKLPAGALYIVAGNTVSANFYNRRYTLAAVFYGIAQQVNKQLAKLHRHHWYGG
jgi:hypothetical protein